MSYDNTIGAVYIGIVVASILYGFTCIQTWYYFTHYPSDRWYIKLLVAGILLTDTVHEALIVHMVYVYVISYFGVDKELSNVVWSLVVEIYFNSFTIFSVQCFLAMRVYRLSNKNWFATGFVLIFVAGEFLTSFILCILAVPLDTYAKFVKVKGLSMSVNAFSAVGDLFIAGFLCYYLHASRTGFERSDGMIKRLIVFTVNTGILTSLFAWGSLITINLWPDAWIYMSFYFCIGRLYCNTLLGTLNARKGLRKGERTDDISLPCSCQGTQQRKGHSLFESSKHAPNNISVKIDTTHEYIRDEYSSSNGEVKNPEVV